MAPAFCGSRAIADRRESSSLVSSSGLETCDRNLHETLKLINKRYLLLKEAFILKGMPKDKTLVPPADFLKIAYQQGKKWSFLRLVLPMIEPRTSPCQPR